MRPPKGTRAQKVRRTLDLLSETASTAERIRGLRALELRVADIALACAVSEETVRKWSNGREPNARGQRLLDRLRYSAAVVVEAEGHIGRAGAWLVSATETLDGQSPVEVFAEQHREVMRLASAHAFALHDARHDPPMPVTVEIVPDAAGKKSGDETERLPRRLRRRRRANASLSPEQARVARMLREGKSVADIAEALQISEQEISRELDEIQEAFGLRNVDAIRKVASEALSQAVAEAASKRES